MVSPSDKQMLRDCVDVPIDSAYPLIATKLISKFPNTFRCGISYESATLTSQRLNKFLFSIK